MSFGRLIFEFLTRMLDQHPPEQEPNHTFIWITRPMEARVDLADKEAVWRILDRR